MKGFPAARASFLPGIF